MSKRTFAKIAAAGVLGLGFATAGVGSAFAGWHHHHHHHHHHASPYFVRYVGVGHVSYPIYRIDHYKIDYASPTIVYEGGCCSLF